MKKNLLFLLTTVFAVATCIILLKLKTAHDEYLIWKTKKAVLEKELEVLQKEVKTKSEFLYKLRDNPEFQSDVARRELGCGTTNETTFRFSED